MYDVPDITEITTEQFDRTIKTNVSSSPCDPSSNQSCLFTFADFSSSSSPFSDLRNLLPHQSRRPSHPSRRIHHHYRFSGRVRWSNSLFPSLLLLVFFHSSTSTLIDLRSFSSASLPRRLRHDQRSSSLHDQMSLEPASFQGYSSREIPTLPPFLLRHSDSLPTLPPPFRHFFLRLRMPSARVLSGLPFNRPQWTLKPW